MAIVIVMCVSRARHRGALELRAKNLLTLFQCALNTETKTKEEKQRFCSVPQKRCPKQPGSGYLFSCLITCLHGYKIGHEKQINKVLFPCVDTLPFGNFGTAGN